MPQAEIRNDRHGIPHHAFPQANGTFLLCSRKADLCVSCKEHGVPVIPADPYETMCDLFREHWDKPWRERLWSVPVTEEPGVLKPQTGAHIVALDGQGADLTAIDLGWFGADASIMLALGALVAVHNDMVPAGPPPAPRCAKCLDTRATDYAGFAMDPCEHGDDEK